MQPQVAPEAYRIRHWSIPNFILHLRRPLLSGEGLVTAPPALSLGLSLDATFSLSGIDFLDGGQILMDSIPLRPWGNYNF